MASPWLKARQTKYAAYATTYILVVLAVVVVANYLGNRYSKSWDATANKRYSLSQETKKIVDGLKSPATITYFNVSTRFVEAKDILDEYTAISPSKVQVKYVDPEKEPMLARAAGIRTIPAATVQIGDHTETATDITEEGITGAFIRDIKGNTRTVCFLTGSGEHAIDDTSRDGASRLKDLLAKDTYQTQSINLIQKEMCIRDRVLGTPSIRLRPLISMVNGLSSGNADPRSILICSAVRSPISRLYFRFR